ncbi:MAG: CHASE2 domain-containing protein [Spirochaetota bacterium]
MSRMLGRPRKATYFSVLIGVVIAFLVLLFAWASDIPERLELAVNDFYFQFRVSSRSQEIEEGVILAENDPFVSDDILIIGIDFNTLNQIGRWPFSRSRHADLLNSFSRISDQQQRESMVLLDLFFVERSDAAHNDALLVDSIAENGRVMIETVLETGAPPSQSYDELFSRHEVLFDNVGHIDSVGGNWQQVPAWHGLQPPLRPYGREAAGYGHANIAPDIDDIFRRHMLVAKSSRRIAEYRYTMDSLEAGVQQSVDESRYERLAWRDRDGREHSIPATMTERQLQDLKRTMEAESVFSTTENEAGEEVREYPVRHYQDAFIPSVTLSMAAAHMNVDLSDIEVVFGEYIRLPDPRQRNPETGEWEPLRTGEAGREEQHDEIRIPINDVGEMMVNFRGPRSSASRGEYQTFPVRSYASYVRNPPGPDPDTWRPSMALQDAIVMVGAFAPGMAADELTTPYGLMYGIEVLANSLNTILTNRFIVDAPSWLNLLVLFVAALLVSVISSRLSTLWAGILTVVLVGGYFVTTILLFDTRGLIVNFVLPAAAMALTFISVIMYRVLTEERDKRRIKSMFGKYVSPDVVSEILENPPELGGVDKELTVMFSDIRGFTSLSEQMTPQELVNHLNVYLSAMSDIILEFRGTLDKYVGDEIMCFWGAPLPQEAHALLACKAALRQLKVLEELNAGWPEERRIEIGIGVNSGVMTVGNMGSSGRLNYTLMGDNVNLGARLEGTNKVYHTNCIISEYTYARVQDEVFARELDTIRVKGKNKPVRIYELLEVYGYDPSPATDAQTGSVNQATSANTGVVQSGR